jgi:hypothetical protein
MYEVKTTQALSRNISSSPFVLALAKFWLNPQPLAAAARCGLQEWREYVLVLQHSSTDIPQSSLESLANKPDLVVLTIKTSLTNFYRSITACYLFVNQVTDPSSQKKGRETR